MLLQILNFTSPQLQIDFKILAPLPPPLPQYFRGGAYCGVNIGFGAANALKKLKLTLGAREINYCRKNVNTVIAMIVQKLLGHSSLRCL